MQFSNLLPKALMLETDNKLPRKEFSDVETLLLHKIGQSHNNAEGDTYLLLRMTQVYILNTQK